MHSASGTPSSKRKKRYYKGSTYGLYLSKRRKKRENTKKSKESEQKTTDSADVCPEEEESSQSFVANSDQSDGELEAESSDLSNDEIETTDGQHNNDSEQVLVDNVIDLRPPSNHTIDLSDDLQHTDDQPNNDESANDHQNNDQDIDYHSTQSQTHCETVTEQAAKKESPPPSASSSIIESIKSRRRRDGDGVPPNPPLSTASSVVSRPESMTKESSRSETMPTLADETTVKPAIRLPAKNLAPNAVHDPNRKTLLRISTAGTVQSGDTHGTYLGMEQSRFVVVVSLLLGCLIIKYIPILHLSQKDNASAHLSQCMCSAKPLIDSSQKDVSKGKPLFCQAIDSFEEKVGL